MDGAKVKAPIMAAKKQIIKSEARNLPVLELKKKKVDKSCKVGVSISHPLLIDVILDKVFSFTNKKDLPACRTVCKLWNLRVIPCFRQEFEIFLWTLKVVCKREKDKSLGTFVQLMRTSIRIPFAKYRLDLNSRGYSRFEFFKICGPEMTHLTLENCSLKLYDGGVKDSDQNDLYFKENLNELFKFSEKLECLHFNTPIMLSKNETTDTLGHSTEDNDKPMLTSLKEVSFKGFQGSQSRIPTFFDEFFGRTPKIVGVSLTKMLGAERDTTETLWPDTTAAMFNAIVSTGRMCTIENLTFDSTVPTAFVDQMEKDGNKLKKLGLKANSNQDLIPLRRIIELQKDCLHSLSYEAFLGIGPSEFPRMKTLKVLHVNHSSDVPVMSANLKFREMFPNLQIMTFYSAGSEYLDLCFLGDDPCPKLKSIELIFYELNLTGFENMTQVYSFSSLSSLKLDRGVLTREIVKLIFRNLTNLQVLELSSTLTPPAHLDSLFTGIPAQDFTEMKKDPTYWDFMKGKHKMKKLLELAQLRVSPSIADLKNLRRLCLKFRAHGLTDVTGYLGLYELKLIRHMHIDFCKFTNTCCEALKKELNLESWVFRQKKGEFHPKYYDHELGQEKMDIIPPYHYTFKDREKHPRF